MYALELGVVEAGLELVGLDASEPPVGDRAAAGGAPGEGAAPPVADAVAPHGERRIVAPGAVRGAERERGAQRRLGLADVELARPEEAQQAKVDAAKRRQHLAALVELAAGQQAVAELLQGLRLVGRLGAHHPHKTAEQARRSCAAPRPSPEPGTHSLSAESPIQHALINGATLSMTREAQAGAAAQPPSRV